MGDGVRVGREASCYRSPLRVRSSQPPHSKDNIISSGPDELEEQLDHGRQQSMDGGHLLSRLLSLAFAFEQRFRAPSRKAVMEGTPTSAGSASRRESEFRAGRGAGEDIREFSMPMPMPTREAKGCRAGSSSAWGFGAYPSPCRGMSKNDSRRDAETQRKGGFESSSSSHPAVSPVRGAHAPDFLTLSAAPPLCARFLLHECRVSDSCSGVTETPSQYGACWAKGFCRPFRGWVFIRGTEPSAHALGYRLTALRAWGHGLGQGCVDRIRVVGGLRG